MKKGLIGLILASVIIAGIANASELTLKTTEKYYEALNVKNSLKTMVDLVGNQMLNSIYANVLQEAKKKRMSQDDVKIHMRVVQTNVFDIKNSMLMNIDQLVPVKKLVPDIYYPALKKHFSEEEIVELIKFYNTPLGKKMIAEMSLVTQESAQLLGQSPQYLPALQKFLSGELDKRKDVMKKEIETESAKAKKEQKKTTK